MTQWLGCHVEWQEFSWDLPHLLPPKVHVSRKLKSRVELELKLWSLLYKVGILSDVLTVLPDSCHTNTF